MKTQIIQLERHDTLISTQDKMAWDKTRRILLVWPAGFPILNRRYDLVALNRYARKLGAQLGIVTNDDQVKLHASRLKIPFFRTVGQAQNKHWKESALPYHWITTVREVRSFRQERPVRETASERWSREGSILRWFIFVVCIVGFAGILYLILPSAQISIPSDQSIQQVVIPILAREDTGEPLPSGVVRYEMRSAIVEGRLSISSTGTASIPDAYASGKVRFTNLTNDEILIPKGTVVRPLSDSSRRYVTTQTGSLPKMPESTVDLPVQAVSPGESFDLPENQIDAIEGSLGLDVTVSNPEPIQGGTDLLVPAASAADHASLERDLERKLSDQAWKEIQDPLEPGDLTSRSTLMVYRVISKNFDSDVGQAVDQISLEMRVEFRAAVIPYRNLDAAVQPVLDNSLPDGFAPISTDIAISELEPPVTAGDGTYQWRLKAERRISREVDRDALADHLAGMKVGDARTILRSELGLDVPPTIQVRPAWWPSMPLLTTRTEIVVVGQ